MILHRFICIFKHTAKLLSLVLLSMAFLNLGFYLHMLGGKHDSKDA